jgi:hypothetical protein
MIALVRIRLRFLLVQFVQELLLWAAEENQYVPQAHVAGKQDQAAHTVTSAML